MLTEERYAAIIERLHLQGIVKLQELVDVLGASESTIRRDLIDLESRQMLKRIHGGAALVNEKTLEPGMEEKTFKNIQQKRRLPVWLHRRSKMANAFIWMQERQR